MAKLFLRKVEVKDAPLITKWFNDTETVKFMSTVVRCKLHTDESIEHQIKMSNPDFERLFMVCLEDRPEPIGHAGIDELDFYDKRGELFLLIGEKSERGKGYGVQIVNQLLDFAFNELKLNSVFATVTCVNKPSMAAFEKAGFSKIGVCREFNFIDGKFWDELFYDITLKDYTALRTAQAKPAVVEKK